MRQGAAQAAGCRLGAAIPEAGGDGRAASRTIGEDGPGEESQGGQALARFGRVDEGAGGAEHLFGGQGQLFHHPAIVVEGMQGLGRDAQR